MFDGPLTGTPADSLLSVGSSNFGRHDAGILERTFIATARRFRSRLQRLVDDLGAGRIDLAGFNRSSAGLLRDGLGISYSLGALSVDAFHTLTVRDMRIINRELEEERSFLKAFGRDLQRGFYVLNPVQRAGLYLQALRGMFELGRTEAAPPGPYEWVLGPTEHCVPCLQASLGGPYQKNNFTHLGLDVLPGIPGSGDVCRGLTSCGCTIHLLGGLPLPNEDLQKRLRGILSEILNDTS